MDIRIVQIVLDVFDHYGEAIRFDVERFEEALNDEAPELMDECYLVSLGIKSGVFDAFIFENDIDVKGYVYYIVEKLKISEKEALFMVSVLHGVVKEMGYYFEIPQLEYLLQQAYERQDWNHLFVVGKTYFDGFGVHQDYEKAFQIFSYLYSLGNTKGAYYLGYMYEHGYGVEQDIEKALMFYHHDDSLCEFRLGMLYMLGRYVKVDDDLAYQHFAKSQEKDAYLYQGLLLERRRDYAGAFDAYYQGAQLFQRECLYKTGMFLRIGLGVEMNLKEAYRCFEYAYFLFHGDATYQLAMMFLDGIVVKKDEKRALSYLQRAVSLYNKDACLVLARFYELGQYVEKNHQKSLYYYHKASELISGKGVGEKNEDL